MSSLDRRSFLATSAVGGVAALSLSTQRASAAEDTSSLGKTPHTKFAVNCEMWYTKLPFLDRVKQAAALGFPAIEFWPWQGKDIDAIAKLSKELGIAIAQFSAWGFRPGLNVPKNHDAFVKAVADGCEVAKKLDCNQMCV